MTDDKDKIIELHEKLETIDRERDDLKRKLSKHTTWYRNPAMLTALTGMLAGIGTTAENILTRYEEARQEKQQEQVDNKTNSAAIEFLLDRQDAVEETCMTYADAIMEAMPNYQRRKVEKFLEDTEGVEVEEAADDVGVGSIGTAGGGTVAESVEAPQPAPVEVMVAPTEAEPASSKGVYDMIQEQVQTKGAPDFKELEKAVKKRKQKQSQTQSR